MPSPAGILPYEARIHFADVVVMYNSIAKSTFQHYTLCNYTHT